jgi:NAD(P)-dependent dehydrogenase (short-subunit alcohol dehydrogenase family)
MNFANKTFVITGAGEGIGAASARYFAQRGARVGLIGRTWDNIAAVAEEIAAEGGTARAFQADIRDEAALEEALRSLAGESGGLDGVFANAGVNGKWAPMEDLSVEEFAKTISINLIGTYTTLHAAQPFLNEGAWLTLTSSINGTRVFTNLGAKAYAASKSGQVTLAKMLAVELAPRKIRVNVVCPGAIDTAISDNTEREAEHSETPSANYPKGKIPLTGDQSGRAEDVADLVGFLASDRASHLTGAVVHLDGAQSLLMG